MRRWVLIISLCLNALLIGFILGDLSRPIKVVQSLSEVASHYPDEIRRSIRRNLIAERGALRQQMQAYNAARAEMFEALRAPEPDRTRIEALMAEVRKHTGAVQESLQSAMLDAVGDASPEARAAIETPVLGERFLGLRNE